MAYSNSARTTSSPTPKIYVAALLVVIAVIAGVSGYWLMTFTPSSATPSPHLSHSEHSAPTASTSRSASDVQRAASPGKASPAAPPRGGPRTERRVVPRAPAALGSSHGSVPDGTTVFDDEVAGVAKLDAALLRALRQAAADAADDGIELYVESGWRSPAYQVQLLREAISKYGSAAEAARWVATPKTSAHVSGDAVDIGPPGARAWMSKRGATYGLCQIYRNEPWHFELRPNAVDQGCPRMYADPTQDPRMQP